MKKELLIFEGPMCCPTGVCGPNVDKNLIDITETLKKIANDYKDLKIIRGSMSFNVEMLLKTPVIRELVKANGPSILPVTLIDGNVVMKQKYPKYEELKELLDA
jgi:hypothetical protein